MTELFAGVFTILFCAGSLAVYCAPAIVAHKRGKRNRVAITVLTLLTGWTGIGWLAALVWSLCED